MMFSSVFIAATAAFLPLINAHIVMVDPQPYGAATENAPLEADGSNFPCKLTTGSTTPVRTYIPGVASNFTLMGSAVHGGGSCQISITYDNPPTANSVFKVVQSYEGACPVSTTGNLPADPNNLLPKLPVTFPTGIKSGEAVFVWTWFNKVGNREMYMNCAPITIGGSESSTSTFDALPNMFVANIGSKGKCTTKETVDIVFPEPGQNVIVAPASDGVNFGPACGEGSSNPTGSTPSSIAGTGSSPSATTPVASSIGTPLLVGGGQLASSGSAAGTIFTEINPTSTPAAASMTTFMTMTMTTSQAVVVPTFTPSVASSMAATSTSPVASMPTGSTTEGTCSKEGMWCIAGQPSVWAMCDGSNITQSGQAVPPGTWCDPKTNQFAYMSTMTSRQARQQRRSHVKKSHGHHA